MIVEKIFFRNAKLKCFRFFTTLMRLIMIRFVLIHVLNFAVPLLSTAQTQVNFNIQSVSQLFNYWDRVNDFDIQGDRLYVAARASCQVFGYLRSLESTICESLYSMMSKFNSDYLFLIFLYPYYKPRYHHFCEESEKSCSKLEFYLSYSKYRNSYSYSRIV